LENETADPSFDFAQGRLSATLGISELSPAGTAESVASRFSRPCGTSRIGGRVSQD
jgi:hypothetical protein